MMKYIITAFLILVAILSSCKETEEKSSIEQLLKEIKEAESKIPEQQAPISFWKNMLNQNRYASDRVAKASINYNIGNNFAPLNINSSEIYMTKALILIEDVKDFEREKVITYDNLANVIWDFTKVFMS